MAEYLLTDEEAETDEQDFCEAEYNEYSAQLEEWGRECEDELLRIDGYLSEAELNDWLSEPEGSDNSVFGQWQEHGLP